jgi:hypothetical protein
MAGFESAGRVAFGLSQFVASEVAGDAESVGDNVAVGAQLVAALPDAQSGLLRDVFRVEDS